MEQNDTIPVTDATQVTNLPAGEKAVSSRSGWRRMLLLWFTAWEIYPVVLAAAFLRFYQLGLTEFDTDQAVLWNTARVALTRGLIPTASNLSSIGTPHPPLTIYILMAVGIFTGNPLAGAIITALFNVLAVLFTYIFTRRYFGRLAGFVAASLTATAVLTILYSRFIWQPNLVAPLIVLYMLALFRGAVEQHSGWFIPALVLLALSFQLSESSIYLAPALVLALILGYKTVRWRDMVLSMVLCALIFLPYAVLEAARGFADLPLMLGASGGHSSIDGQALSDYLHFLSSYGTPPTDPHLLFKKIFKLMYLHRLVMLILIFASFLLLFLGLFWQRVQLIARDVTEQRANVSVRAHVSSWRHLWDRWEAFVASPQRRGLLLLLAWQFLPLLLLSRHSIALQVHYMLVLMPGPFILIGLLVSQFTSWCALLPNQSKLLRLLVPALAVLLILVQTLGGVAWLLDNTDGAQSNTANNNTLQDLRNAVQTADQLAYRYHFHHIYIDTNGRTVDALTYLAGQIPTANTLMQSKKAHCLLLPTSTQGPAVMLFGPGETFDESLLTHFTSATLVSTPPRLGGAPFHIYLVQPLTATGGAVTATSSLTLARSRSALFTWSDPGAPAQPPQRLLVTFWHNHARRPAQAGSWWTYHFVAAYSGNGANGQSGAADCRLTSLTPDEQMLIPFSLPANSTALPASLAISGTITSETPYVLNYGPLHFQTLRTQSTQLGTFQEISAS